MSYNIISTGSKGNAVVIRDNILIDCGVSFKALNPYIEPLKIVLLTHGHGDHFNPTAIRILARERPTLRFACGFWLVPGLIAADVQKHRIDVLNSDNEYDYGTFKIFPVPLSHNVPNFGYKIHFPDWRVFYATDTANLNGITARDYDLYMVECNWEEEELRERIGEKKGAGEFSYEIKAMQNHLSKARCDEFIYRNAGQRSQYVYLHCHEGANFN